MARKQKLDINVTVDTETEHPVTLRFVTFLFQGQTYILGVGDTFHVHPRLQLTGDFQTEVIEGIDLPIEILGVH